MELQNQATHIDQLLANSECIGVIGSPSSTSELALDILGTAAARKLVGELALFGYNQDQNRHYVLGQITEITLKNIWHEDPTMRSLIRLRGRLDPVSERQDTHLGQMITSAVFGTDSQGYYPSMLGTVPSTGTPIYLVSDEILEEVLRPYQPTIFYLGKVYGSQPRLPLWFKHFDSGPDGAGEAYHLGIFGKTGSGKSVLAKMVLLAYAKHKQMGLLVFDPQGEFARDLRTNSAPTKMGEILCKSIVKALDRTYQVYDLHNIQLSGYELLRELLLVFDFFDLLGIKGAEKQEQAADFFEGYLRESKQHKQESLDNEALRGALNDLGNKIDMIYSGQSYVTQIRHNINRVLANMDANEFDDVKDRWDKAAHFFKRRPDSKSPWEIISGVLNKSGASLVVIDLSQAPAEVSQGVWEDKIKPMIIDNLLRLLMKQAEQSWQDKSSLNTLVVIDEAHRLAPRDKQNNPRMESIKSHFIDAVRTTRKYGLGWMFLSQTLSSLDEEIIQQLRIFFFGFGLSMGTEYRKLTELVGGQKSSVNLYQRFRDPQSAFDTNSKEYSFMTIGPVSPLSFSGTPLFLNAYNTVDDFLQANGLKIKSQT